MRRPSFVLAASVLWLVAGVTRAESVPFDDAGIVATESGGIDAALHADLDGDGDDDLVYASRLFARVSWSRNDRTGYASRVSLFAQADVRRLIAADFDLDGRVDLVSATGAGELVLRLGTGTLTNNVPQFDVRAPMTTTLSDIAVMAVGDINRDGRPDLVVGRDDAAPPLQSFLFLESATDGFNGPTVVPVPATAGRIAGLAIADIDADGLADVVATANASTASATATAQVFVVPRTSTSQFGTPVVVSASTGPAGPQVAVMGALVVADFDLAQGPDIAYIANASSNTARIDRRLNVATGSFDFAAPVQVEFFSPRVDALSAVDVDRDGDADIAFASPRGGFAYIADNNRARPSTPTEVSDAVAIGDGIATLVFDDDLDGDPDFLVARAGGDVHRSRNVRIHGRAFAQTATTSGVPAGGPVLSGPFDVVSRRVARGSGREVLLAETAGGRVHAVSYAGAQPVFGATPILANASGAQDMAVLDFDYDGDEDFALAVGGATPPSAAQNRVILSRNQPVPANDVQSCAGGVDLRGVDLGELGNVPGLSIAAVYAAQGNDRVALFASCPSETALYTVANGIPDGPTSVRIGDVDDDGDQDVLVAAADRLGWYPNSGNGSFGAFNRLGSVDGVRDATLFDIDRDGRLDIAFGVSAPTSPVASAVFYFTSSRTGILDRTVLVSAGVIETPGRIEAADVDHDGDIDLFLPSSATSTRPPARTHCGVSFVEALGNGDFAVPRCLDSGSDERPYSRLVVDDLDADGVVDVVASSQADNTVVRWNSGRPAQFGMRIVRLVDTLVLDAPRETCAYSLRLQHFGRAGDSDLRYATQIVGANRFDTENAVDALILRRDDGDGVPEPSDAPVGVDDDPRTFDNTWALDNAVTQTVADGEVQYWLCVATTAQPPGPAAPLELRLTQPTLNDAHAFDSLRGALDTTASGSVRLISARVFADGLETR